MTWRCPLAQTLAAESPTGIASGVEECIDEPELVRVGFSAAVTTGLNRGTIHEAIQWQS